MKKIFIALIMTITVWASEYSIGQIIAPMKLNDQFGAMHNIAKIPHTIIMTFEKEPSSIINKFLSNKPKDYLQKNNAIFIADISQMPAFVTKMYALPAMQKYNYDVLLIEDEDLGLRFPSDEGKITIIKTDNSMIKNIEYTDDISKLEHILKQ